jgi:two-component system CheB/CheR fusion protein
MLKRKVITKKTTGPKKKSPKSIKTIKHSAFPIVAIGASTGGLDAVSVLFKNLPSNTGMAFIYVQHISSSHKSFLTSILSKETTMRVQEIENMENMAPDNIYVMPNNKDISVMDGHIRLIPRSKSGAAISIDVLFSSLAKTHKENVMGIVLSGNAHDGTQGLKAIKAAGGITFAQDKSAQAGSMPESAIASGVVDFVLSPKKIALELVRLSKMGFMRRTLKKAKEVSLKNTTFINNNDPHLKTILEFLYKKTGVNFSFYKITTVKRRINHRMLQCGLSTIKEYTKLLLKKSEEKELLYKDLLINVTSFFRDMETFRYLKTTFLQKLLKNKLHTDTLRVWIPACSTGEEAYSIAMLLMESQDRKTKKIPIQIFATDLSEQAIRKARQGEYLGNDLRAMSKKRIERFFVKTGNIYRVVKELREICVFAPHNILSDPPFSRIDFISCRNLLIYFDIPAQKKALTAMHFALNDGGYLLLGKSETTGTASSLFNQLISKFRIYTRKKNTGIRILPELTHRFRKAIVSEKIAKPLLKKNVTVNSTELEQAVDAVLLTSYMPACVIINKDMEILKFRGLTSLYLSHPSGNASLNILKMIRPEFAFELRNAIQECMKTKRNIRKPGIELNLDMTDKLLGVMSIEVRSLKIEWGEPLFLIVFTLQEQVEKFIENAKDRKSSLTAKDRKIKKQIEDLNKTSAEMATIIESQDRAYEELQAANEEIISASEEFQTLNEELETSKEEIEATNEELQTTNQELQIRNEQLAESYNFSEAVAETMHEPMLILDKYLRIKSANKSFYKKFKLIQATTEGKLLYELGNHQWGIPRLRQLLENIIQKNTHFYEYEITHDFPVIGKKTMLLNARRIVQKTQDEQLILLSFIDITERAQKRKLEKKELEDIIGERTKELAQSHHALEEKNTFLEKTNKELETFTFISSHDLQEPLRKIKMFSSALLEEESNKLSDSGIEQLKKIKETVKRMQLLIDDLLIYSNAKKVYHHFEQTDLNIITESVIVDFDEFLIEKNGKIKTNGPCYANIIAFQFRQLMYNLISNAIKFAHADRDLRINIKSEIVSGKLLKDKQLLPNANYCHICVKDNGIGFDPLYKDKIFEVFQRLHGQREFKGTGIGLAICKRIVENHKGIITATGKLNEGAMFDIYIPTSGN